MDLSNLTFEEFSSRIGEEFRIALDDGESVTLELTAAEIKAVAGTPDHPDSAFSVLFRGLLTHPLGQQMYEFEHSELGTLPLFVVPVQEDENGFYYEAVFTRLEERS